MTLYDKQFYIKRQDGKYWAGGAQQMARWVDHWSDAIKITSEASANAYLDGGTFDHLVLMVEERND